MSSESGRYVLVFNGEIYNFRELREELDALRNSNWNSHSDTEVLLTAFENWGTTKTLNRLDGMFALALYDKQDDSLILARDRIGEKPLYYQRTDNGLLFASELKAFSDKGLSINTESLDRFLRYGYISGNASIYSQIRKLPAGCYLSFKIARQQHEVIRYWDLHAIACTGLNNSLKHPKEEILDSLESLLKKSVKSRMIADVPVGAFLSGGYDSTLVVSIMQELSTTPVKTFTIGFPSEKYNEAEHALSVSKILGTDHTEAYLSPEDALQEIPNIPSIYCEPFADPSLIPTIIVSRLAQKKVKTVLSGDGGDELFWGYNRHIWAHNVNKLRNRYPNWAFNTASEILKRIPVSMIARLHSILCPALPKSLRSSHTADKIRKLSNALTARNAREFYEGTTSTGKTQEFDPHDLELERLLEFENRFGPVPTVVLIDMIRYLPEDILTKVDRASMSCGIEARVPLLSQELIEFSWRVPSELKIREGSGKWLLKQLVHRKVPKAIMDRPKAGFSVPIGDWLRGPLKEWAGDFLSKKPLSLQNELDPNRTNKLWEEHQSKRFDHSKELWNILTFLSWLESQA